MKRGTLLALVLALLACPAMAGNKTVTLALQWLPQAQFAGYYVALDKGIYTAHGIDMSILPGGPDKVVSERLDTGRADFGTMFLSTGVERRASGMDLVNVGQIMQHSALMLLVRADANVHEIKDLQGRKVAMWANEFQIQPRLLFDRTGIEVVIVPLGNSMDLFLRGAVQATTGMWYNEYHSLLSYGLRESDITPFFFRDTDFDFPEDGIYCLESTWERDPNLASELVRATLEGWEYAFAHPDEALDIVAKHMAAANIPINMAHQRWMLERMSEVIPTAPGQPVSATLDRAVYARIARDLVSGGFVPSAPSYDQFYKGPKHVR